MFIVNSCHLRYEKFPSLYTYTLDRLDHNYHIRGDKPVISIDFLDLIDMQMSRVLEIVCLSCSAVSILKGESPLDSACYSLSSLNT